MALLVDIYSLFEVFMFALCLFMSIVDHEQIALSGVSCLQQLVVTLGKRFSMNQWDYILHVFQTICKPEDSSSPMHSSGNNLEYERENDGVIIIIKLNHLLCVDYAANCIVKHNDIYKSLVLL